MDIDSACATIGSASISKNDAISFSSRLQRSECHDPPYHPNGSSNEPADAERDEPGDCSQGSGKLPKGRCDNRISLKDDLFSFQKGPLRGFPLDCHLRRRARQLGTPLFGALESCLLFSNFLAPLIDDPLRLTMCTFKFGDFVS